MTNLINLFLRSKYFDKVNIFISRKIFKIFKIFFVQTNLKNLPDQNYKINENDVLNEFHLSEKSLKKNKKPYITYSHLLDLIEVMNKKPLNFFDYGAGNLNLFFYLSKKIKEINYFYHDQIAMTKLLKDHMRNNEFKNLNFEYKLKELQIYLLYFGSSLQYLKAYKDEILKFKNNTKYLLISQTPFFKNVDLKNEFIILKQVNMHPNINFLYSFNYYLFIDFMKRNNFILIDANLNRVTKFLNFKNFKNEYKYTDMYDLLFKKI